MEPTTNRSNATLSHLHEKPHKAGKLQNKSVTPENNPAKDLKQGKVNVEKITTEIDKLMTVAKTVKVLEKENNGLRQKVENFNKIDQPNEALTKILEANEKIKELMLTLLLGIDNTDKNFTSLNTLYSTIVTLYSTIVTFSRILKLAEKKLEKDSVYNRTTLEKFVNHFNSLKNELIESKILEYIIQLNIDTASSEDSSKIQQRDSIIFLFNQVMDELRKNSDQLKRLLIAVHPNDPRLPSTGTFLYYLGKITSARIYSLPGDENFLASETLVEIPKNWIYSPSLAMDNKKAEEQKPVNDPNIDPTSHYLESFKNVGQ